jgi:micrococcal nuclease
VNARLALAALLLTVLLLVRPVHSGHPRRAHGFPATVVRTVDGDTLVAAARGRRFYVRLLGIDTPETHRPGTPIECGGQQASASMRALAPPHARVNLEVDPGQDRIDRYGRLLAYVWLPDGRLLEDEQLRGGWASTYVFRGRPVSLFRRLAATERSARFAGRGVWARCGGDFHTPASR